MPGDLPRLVPAAAPVDRVEIRTAALSAGILGRYVCRTREAATRNGGVQFDAVVIGAGMFGACRAGRLHRAGNLRVLVLDAGPFLVSEHVQNLAPAYYSDAA